MTTNTQTSTPDPDQHTPGATAGVQRDMPGTEARPTTEGARAGGLSGVNAPGRDAVAEDAAGVAEILTGSDLRQLFPGLDLSESDWSGVLGAFDGRPSRRRQMFGESIGLQADMLAGGVFDDDPGPEGAALVRRLDELPLAYRVAVLGVIELFWSDTHRSVALARWLRRIDVRPCESDRQRRAARRFGERTEIPASLRGRHTVPEFLPCGPSLG